MSGAADPLQGLPSSREDGALHAEWATVRQRCGLLSGAFRRLLRLRGEDRTTFLHGMVTNDVKVLQAGEGTYAALLTIQGRVVSDMRIYVLADEIWLDVPAGRAVAVRAALEHFIIADDVEFVDEPACEALAALEGPHATRVLVGVMGDALADVPVYGHRALRFDGHEVRVAVVSHTGETGYLVFGAPELAASVHAHCRAAGAEPVGTAALDVLRLEAGIPWYGRDMDEEMLVSEVGLDGAISFRKGCYLGQEVVERVAARGQVQRRLVGLVCAGVAVPSAGTKLYAGDKEAGWVTSAAWSPALAAVVALGYVRRESWEIGTVLAVAAPEPTTARVAEVPFIRK